MSSLVTIPDLELKHSVQKHVIYKGLLRGIVDKIKDEIPDVMDMKLHPELTKLICNTIEEFVAKGNPFGIDKLRLVVDILDSIFEFNEDEKNQIKNQINFLHDNKDIKKLKLRLKIFRQVGSIITRRFL